MSQSDVKKELQRLISELPFSDRERDFYLRGLVSLSEKEAAEVLADFKLSFANAQPALELAREVLRKRREQKLPEECDCHCHGNPHVRHIMACCSSCSHCGKRIEITELQAHTEKCVGASEPNE